MRNGLQLVVCSLDYEQSLFPLRDSRGKRTSERAQQSSTSLKRDAPVEPLVYWRFDARVTSATRQAISRSLACSFSARSLFVLPR